MIILALTAPACNLGTFPLGQNSHDLMRPKCLILARSRRSMAKGFRSAHRRIADVRAGMSVHRRIADLIPSHGEGQLLTQSVNCELFGLDRFGLVSRPYLDLETIRNQTLPRAMTCQRVSPQGGFAQGTCFGGVLARKLAIEAVKMAASRVLAAKSTSAQ